MNQPLTGNLLVASSLVNDPVYAGGVCLIVHHDESNVIGVMLNRPMKPSAEALLEMLGNVESPADVGHNRLTENDQHLLDEEAVDDASQDQGADEATEFEEHGDEDKDHQWMELDAEPLDQGEFDDQQVEQSLSRPSQADRSVEASQDPSLSEGQNSLFGMLHFGGPRSGPVVAIHQTSQFAEAETGKGIYVAAQKQHLEELVRDHPAPYRLIVGHLGWEHDELAAEMDAGLWHIVPATTEAVFSPANEMWPQLIRRATSNSVARWIGIPDLVAAGDLN